jgi:myo-inositol 2-dehydrogenase/D-chiro-inositol 1-dehydrogenase
MRRSTVLDRAGRVRVMSESLRVGVIGAGLIAGRHVRAYTRAEGVDVVAVADTHLAKAEQLAASVGAEARTGLDEVLALETDVISICTPPSSHAELTVRALQAGRPRRPVTVW